MTFFVEGLRKPGNDVKRMGEAETLDQAISIAKRLIDAFLISEIDSGTRPEQLYARYQSHGTVPYIFSDGGVTMNVDTFNHLKYAHAQCEKLCSEDPDTTLDMRPLKGG